MPRQILNPDRSLLDQGAAWKDYPGRLWQTGDHVIEVVNRSNRMKTDNVIFGIN